MKEYIEDIDSFDDSDYNESDAKKSKSTRALKKELRKELYTKLYKRLERKRLRSELEFIDSW